MLRRALPVMVSGLAVGLTALLPAAVGLSWSAITAVLAGLTGWTLAGLTALWLSGLVVHTAVLTAALPGLSHRRALLLNLSGSAVSNLLPFGAAGAGLNYVMTRAWQIPTAAFASFTAISNLWNVLGRILVGTAILCAALAFGLPLPSALHPGVAFASVGVLVTVVALGVAAVCSSRVSRRMAVVLDGILAPLAARTGRTIDLRTSVTELRATSAAAVSRGWAQLTLGVLGYLFMQALLMAACLAAVGAHAPWPVVAVAFAIDRLISALPVTPGGAGLAELGSAVALVSLGVDPVSAAAGTVLYRLFTFLLEIPLGGAGALLWLGTHRRGVRTGATA